MRRKHESILKVGDIEISSSGDVSDNISDNHSTHAFINHEPPKLEKVPSLQPQKGQIFEYDEKVKTAKDDEQIEESKRSNTSEDSLF